MNNNDTINHNNVINNNLDTSNPTPRNQVVLLLDTSSSMDSEPIKELNADLRQFIQKTADNETISRSIELEVITFNSHADVIMAFAPICNMDRDPAPLIAQAPIAMGDAMRMTLKDLKAQRKLYRDNEISSYRPWVILMTDKKAVRQTLFGQLRLTLHP